MVETETENVIEPLMIPVEPGAFASADGAWVFTTNVAGDRVSLISVRGDDVLAPGAGGRSVGAIRASW